MITPFQLTSSIPGSIGVKAMTSQYYVLAVDALDKHMHRAMISATEVEGLARLEVKIWVI